ncbi:protein of unknown function [Salinihabitans flavidus]|uniref:DUF4336 domain-containing protein n=1 Tax=Salinihabitans flavidus TaxID=569882 RepID=A0A1H8QBP7_9RHOB|nr:DUF4336 domain-containing protein [Salinihabitans flavidus]SEO51344.1 protein of unknown function [Salinihabitans flavidus]
MPRATGYEPLNTLKPVARGLWLIDGPAIRFMGLPFSTRATVVRLDNGDLWVHSPTALTDGLRGELDALGPVRHLIAPNWIHYAHLPRWQAAFPEAIAWGAPGVAERAAKKGVTLRLDHELQWDGAEAPWSGQIDQMIVRGSEVHREAVFFHRASATLILTDLIEAFETANLPVWMRPIVRIAGIDDSDGKMPPDMRWTFRDKAALVEDVTRMIDWAPERVILAHGRWFDRGGAAELERAFRHVLKSRS